MKKFLCILLIFASALASYSQDALSAFSLNSLPQMYRFNPAEYDSYPNALILPGTGYFLNYNNDVAFNDAFTEAKTSFVFNQNKFLTKLNSDDFSSRILLDANVELFYFSFKLPRNTTVRIFSNFKSFFNGYYPINVSEGLLNGWGGVNVGRTFSDDIDFYSAAFIEAGVGITRGFGRALQLGASFKYYSGVNYINTNETHLSIKSYESDYSLEVSSKNLAVQTSLAPALNSGWGVGIDIGATYDFGLKSDVPLRLGLSFLDIGFIQWNGLGSYSSDSGAFVAQELSDINLTELNDIFYNYKSEEQNILRQLPMRFFGSVSYYPTEKDLFTFSSFNTYYTPGSASSSISLAYSRKIWRDKISLSVSGVKLSDRPVGLGAGFSARFGALQFYATSDDLFQTITAFSDIANDARHINLRAGLNILLGIPKVTGGNGGNRSFRRGGSKSGGGYQSRDNSSSSSSLSSSVNNKKSASGRVPESNPIGPGGGVRAGSRGGNVNTHDYFCSFCRPPNN